MPSAWPMTPLYGLAAAVWTANINVAHRVMQRGARRHGVGESFDRSTMATPFGGFKIPAPAVTAPRTPSTSTVDLKTIWTAYR